MFLNLTKILSILLALPLLITLLLPAPNTFKANTSNDLIVFNIRLSNISNLLKS